MNMLATVVALTFTALAIGRSTAETVTVLQVIDGDTCVLDDHRKIRYLGVDAPEKGDSHAEESTQANNNLVGGKKVRLRFGKPAQDRDGRLLAYVFVGKMCINQELVRQGHAYVRRPVAAEYKESFLKAQEEACQAGRGIWAKASDRHLAIAAVHAKPGQGTNNSLKDEYILIENRGKKELNCTGWTVSDESHRRYLFPRFTLPAGGKVTLRTGLGKNSAAELFWGSRTSIWNDHGDTIFINDAKGNLILSHIY